MRDAGAAVPTTARNLTAALVSFVALLVAGCGTSEPAAGPTDVEATSGGACAEATIGFWGFEGPAAQNWSNDALRLGYTLKGEFILVAFEDEQVLGTDHVSISGDHAVSADGAVLNLDEPLSGEHTVTVVVYADSNDNGSFDPDADRPCASDGDLVQAGPTTIDFDRFTG
ncbi:MAG: hypothetical protein R3343_09150 [Nitriliruptorales bacterium]|nr:hypothetical protein [Nitriliruptorales bacterium]